MTQHKRQRVFAMLTALSLFFCNSGVFSGTFAEGNTGEVRRVQLICGKEEHIHSEACYEKALICGEEEKEAVTEKVFRSNFKVHHHKDSCYDGSGNLTCGLIEDEYYHTHNEYCQDAEGNLVCGLGTRKPHEHTAECYQTERKLTCGLEETEEHIHCDACYETTETLICEKPTTKHEHTAECYNAEGKVICGKMEVPTFTCTEENWAEEVISEGHTHTEACYEERLSCGMEEHTHTDACYEEVQAEEPTEEEPVKEPEEEIKEEEAPAGEQAEETEEEETTEENGEEQNEEPEEESGEEPTEELTEEPTEETTEESAEEVTEESGEETKEEPEEEPGEEPAEENEEEPTEETTGESAEEVMEESGEETKEEPEEEPGEETTEELTEEPGEEPEEEPAEEELTEEAAEEQIKEELTEEATEETGEEQNEEPAEEIGETVQEEPEESIEEPTEERTEEQNEEQEEEPSEEPVEEPTEELAEEATEEPTEETTKEAGEEQNEEITEEEKTEENEEGRIETGDTAAYRVVISFHKDAGIPEGTEVTVNEADGNGAKGVQNEEPVRGMLKSTAKMRMSAKAAPIEEAHANIASLTAWRTEEAAPEIILYQKTLDISLVADGEEIEPDPEAKITVTVELPGIEDGQEVEVRHITEKGAELLESTNEGGSITFETDSFSLFEFTARAQAISGWETEQTENTFYGKTTEQNAETTALTETEAAEGLEILEAYSVTGSDDLWVAMRQKQMPELGERESITLYTVTDGKADAIVRENISGEETIRFSTAEMGSYALVKDTGYRHKSLEMTIEGTATEEGGETGEASILLDGMMPKAATAAVADVTEAYAGYAFEAEEEQAEGEDEEENEPAEAEEKESRTALAAWDISIYENGTEYQPDAEHPIRVEITDERIQSGENIELWHIKDDGTKEKITAFTAEAGRISFDATGFSIYIVIDHESETVVNPRVEFHFIAESPTPVEVNGSISYYIGNPYVFYNKHDELQNSQILMDGETLQLITDPGNRAEQFFYGWYIVNPHPIEGQTDIYGIGTADSKLYYSWTSAPVSVTFETPISIPQKEVQIGAEVSWSIGSVSGSGIVDSDGSLHVLLAPVFEKYNFANFMLYPRDSGETASKTLMTRKMIALGSSSDVEVKISDIRSASADPVHLIFTGWEYREADENGSAWNYKQTVDYTGAEMTDPGKDGVYINVNLEDTTSIDLYPKFVQARWIDFFSGVSGSGATYVASRFRESWGTDPQHPTEGMEENISGEKNVFTSLPVPVRDGYEFGGWYAFAVTDPQTGEITNLENADQVTIQYLDHDYHAHSYTGSMTAVRITDETGAIDYTGEATVTVNEQTYYLFTGNNASENQKILKLFDGIDRLTLYANWIPVDTEITIVYWTENAENSQYTASATKTISTLKLREVLHDDTYKSGSVLTLDILKAYDQAIEDAEGLDSEKFLVHPMALDDVGAVPKKTDPDSLEAREEIFYDRNDVLTREKNTYQVIDDNGDSSEQEGQIIDGQGTTSFNVYFSRKIFKLVFHIGRDNYCKAGGQQRADGDNWLEYMYTDNVVTTVLGRASKGSAKASYPGEAHMTYNGKNYDSTYVTNADNIKFDYVPDPNNENDQNLYIITAKYGERIADRWPSPVNPAFGFDEITASGKAMTPYIWTAAYTSLFHVLSFNRDTPGNPQGANADVNGIFEYMSADLCANRTGNGLINENQVHHLVAWFGEASNQNRFKKYHYLYEKIDGITLPDGAEIHQGTEYLTDLQTTWSAANTNGQGIGVILDDTYYEDPGESPVPVVSNLEPQFQMVTEKDGYQLVYSCYEGSKRTEDNSYHVFFFYKPKEYKLTFMFETPVEEYHLYKQSLAQAEKTAPEKEGYEFVGWFTNEAGEGEPFNFAEATMPSEGVVLYPVYKVLQYRVKIDPNGGVIDHINYTYPDKYGNKAVNFGVTGEGYNSSQATYFTANYRTTVGEYSIKREYIKLTEKEKDLTENVYVPEEDRYYYLNAQYKSGRDGEWGLPPNLRNAVYMKEDQLRNYYLFYKKVATDYLPDYSGVHIFQTFDEFAAAYTSYPDEPYRKLKEGERYSFMGWYKVTDGSVASMPYDFNEPVLEDLQLRALWRLDGGYYLKYDPDFIGTDKNGNKVSVTGIITQWTDPQDASKQLYADQAPTHILHAPENVEEGWVFRGWRVVKSIGTETITVDGVDKECIIWDPIQLDDNGNAVYYQPGNGFIVDSNYVSETTDLGSVIYMQAYYEPIKESVRRPDIANLKLDANGGYITDDEMNELEQDKNLHQLGKNGTVLLDADDDQIIFGDIQSNIAVHLAEYAVHSQYQDRYNDVVLKNYFKHQRAFFLLGFDREPDTDYIAEFPADGVIAVQRTDNDTLYAVWEKMVYVNFINKTDKDITIDLTGTGNSTVSIVNVATGLFDREKTTSHIIVPARSNGVDGRVKIVLPGATPGTDEFIATAINDHFRTKMSVSGEFGGSEYTNFVPSIDVKYGGSVVYRQKLQEDMDGVGIIVTYTEEPVEEVVYDVNGGSWTQPADTGYEHQLDDIYARTKETIEADPSHNYHPTDPTRDGMIFVGWTEFKDIADHTDFHSEEEVIWGDVTITPDEGSTVLQKVIDNYLWDFSAAPPYDRTLYAVWSETATVTFNLTRSGKNIHNWTEQETATEGNYVYYREDSTSNKVTYTVMKGEKVPQPQNPTCGSNLKRTFMQWVTVANYIDDVDQWTTVSRFAFDFDKPVNNDIIIYTSWRDNKNYQIFTFTVNNIVEDPINENDEFTYTISAEDVELKTASSSSSYAGPAVAFAPVTTKLKNGGQYTIKITTLRETSNDKHNYTSYDVYAEVIDREGHVLGSGHLLNYRDADDNLINEGREYTYTIRVAQEPADGYSTNVYTDETGKPMLTLLHNQFTFRGSNGDHYKPHTNPFAENGNKAADVTFVNQREVYLTLTKDIPVNLGDWERNFTFTLESVGAEGEEREGTEYAYTKTKNSQSTGTDWLTTAAGGNTFTLMKGESIRISLPYNKDVVITESNGLYTTEWTKNNSNDTNITILNGDTAAATIKLTGNSAITVTNTRETQLITVKKIVDSSNTSGIFDFTASVKDGDIPFVGLAVDGNITTDSNGDAHFSLTHDETRTLTIPYGATLVVTEALSINHTPSAEMVDENNVQIQDGDTGEGSFTVNSVTTDGTITFTNTPTMIRRVYFDVNHGDWTDSPNFEALTGDMCAIAEGNITGKAYKPNDPTYDGKIFIGWTDNEDIAKTTTDFSSTEPMQIGSETVIPAEGGIVLDKIRSDYLWDFREDPPYDQTLYAVWSDAVTVTYNIIYSSNYSSNPLKNHTWTDDTPKSTKTAYAYYSTENGYIKYTIAKGEKAPKPSDPTPNSEKNTWNFMLWLKYNSTTNEYRYNAKEANDQKVISNTYDFSESVLDDITLSTSWTALQPQYYTFTIENRVINGGNDEFDYTIEVVDDWAWGKPQGQGNKVMVPDIRWGSLNVKLKNNQKYTVRVKVTKITQYNGVGIEIEVIDMDDKIVKNGQLIYCAGNTNKNFVSDFMYTLKISQATNSDYATVVSVEEKDPADSADYFTIDQTNLAFSFRSCMNQTKDNATPKNFFKPEENVYVAGENKSLTIVFTNTGDEILLPAPTSYSSRNAPYLLLMASGIFLVFFSGGMSIIRKKKSRAVQKQIISRENMRGGDAG